MYVVQNWEGRSVQLLVTRLYDGASLTNLLYTLLEAIGKQLHITKKDYIGWGCST
jgi:hypothetical protein